jgi:hypothetical protein
MLRLVYQSTGNEASDRAEIERRLHEKKKVPVVVQGFQEEVRTLLNTLFGRDCIQEMALHSEDSVTRAQEWKCVLHRESKWETLGKREQERAEERSRMATVFLTHHSTGDEARDQEVIERRLVQDKNVRVTVLVTEGDVRSTLEQYFGEGCVQGMALFSQDSETHAQVWQCTLKRVNDLQKLSAAAKFAEQLVHVAEPLTLHEFSAKAIPGAMIRDLREKYAHVWSNDGTIANMAGLVAEKVWLLSFRERLQQTPIVLNAMSPSDVSLNSSAYRVHGDDDPDRITFQHREIHDVFKDFMEVDAFFQAVDDGSFVAFDVTVGVKKKTEARKDKLKVLSQILGSPVVLIDVFMREGTFRYRKMAENIYRWNLPCTVNFEALMAQIVPPSFKRNHGRAKFPVSLKGGLERVERRR